MSTEAPVLSIMTVDPITISPDSSLSEAVHLFKKHKIRHLPVINASKRLVGIVSQTDFRGLSEQSINGKPCTCEDEDQPSTCSCNSMAPLLVADVMSSGVVSLNPEDSLGLAADLFLSKAFHAAPVVEDNEVVGIVTSHDLLRVAYADVLPLR